MSFYPLKMKSFSQSDNQRSQENGHGGKEAR